VAVDGRNWAVRERVAAAAVAGVVLDRSHVLTTAQIVSGAERQITVQVCTGRRYEARLVAVDPLYFLSVLEVDGVLPVDPLPLAPTEEVQPGDPVVAIGNVLGHDINVTAGVVTAVDRTIYRPERLPVDGLLITDALIYPGNIGGALVRQEDGKLVGICGLPWQHGLGLAVHADVAWRIANQIIDYGQATHPWLGFSGEPEIIDQAMVQLFSLPFDRGVTVTHVAADGPGARAGVQVNDLVVRVKERQVSSLGSIRKVLALHRHGERVPLSVLRGGELIELELVVEEMPRLHGRGERP
jgi:S1-C subfamily serine protease